MDMFKKFISYFILIFLSFCFNASFASAKIQEIPISVKKDNANIVLRNNGKTMYKLNNADLTFYFNGTINQANVREITTNLPKTIPHQHDRQYRLHVGSLSLRPNQSFNIKLDVNGESKPYGYRLASPVLIPVPVKVTVMPPDWTQTIKICNVTPNAIPMTQIQFEFDFTGNIGSIWGDPWLDWKMSSHEGNHYVLSGGTEYSTPLPSDPNCSSPVTISFSSSPSSAAPTGPFVFSAVGAKPTGEGTLRISLPNAPTPELSSPNVKVEGMGNTYQKVVSWGQSWTLEKLIPGSYTITPANVDNGTDFYLGNIQTADVSNGKVTSVQVTYTTVPTGTVTVKLVTAPSAQQAITFTGSNFTFTKTVSSNSKVILPMDTYDVSASAPGFTIAISPNPLTVPEDNSLTLTYSVSAHIPILGGYFQSWSSKYASDPNQSDLANLPEYINHVYLSFAKPEMPYVKGSLNYQSVGLEFPYKDGQFLKDAIASLHKKHPNTKILVAIGGATYNNWGAFNPKGIADFVSDFGLDGVDIDYEAPNPGCVKGSDGLIHCQVDQIYQAIVQNLRRAVPRPYIIISTCWSISAYGQDQWTNAQPQGDYTGMMLPFFRSAAAKDIDKINVMSYDASDAYDPIEALQAFAYYYHGPISMGVEVPPEAWGGHVYTLDKVTKLTQASIDTASKRNTPPGMMLWSLQKMPNGTPSSTNPSAQMMATTMCQTLGLKNCTDPLFKS